MPPAAENPTIPARYGRMWRSVPRELGFLALTLPIALAGFVTTITLFTTGAGTIITFVIGILLLLAALFVGRGFGQLELTRLEWAGRPPVPRPDWADAPRGFWRRFTFVIGSGHYWLYLLHTMVINFVVSLVTWTLTVIWVSLALGGLTFWFWQFVVPGSGVEWNLGNGWFDDSPAAQFLVSTLLGLLSVATLPFVTRGLVMLHDVIARATLGAFASDALRRQVGDLEASRGAAISAEGHSLRRLERDIHDGPQQRLVRLQMDLAAADRKLDTDPAAARVLIAEAAQQSKDALEELRALSRGFAPPMLLDRGLAAALESAAARSTVPVRVASSLPQGLELPREIERNAYFVASEALANAAKHSGASAVEVTVALRRVAETDQTWLDVSIHDNGRGGAGLVPGHGLAGIEERLRGLGGVLELSSPAGGPTVVGAHLPITVAFPDSAADASDAPTLGR